MAKGDGGDYSSNPASLKQTVSYDWGLVLEYFC
jgi:hypothetical protein